MLGYRSVVFLILAGLFSSVTFALPEDRSQPIEIEADSAVRNEKMGTTVYEGNVIMIQGTIRVEANRVEMFHQDDKINKIICTGQLARYQQVPSKEKGLVIARAEKIEYLLDKDSIHLEKSASVEQSGGTIIGEVIDYDLKNEIVNAKGNPSGKQRIQMVIPPQNIDQKESGGDN